MGSDPSDQDRGRAGLSLWERIWRDPNFVEAKTVIQTRYSLPLPFDIRLDDERWREWLGAKEGPWKKRAKRGRAFLNDISALFKRFEVPDAWYPDFLARIAGTPLEEWRRPKFNLYRDRDGSWKWECVITPETDLTDPHILELIQRQQKLYARDPPEPVKDPKDPRRLDWRPVYRWHKKHPLFTIPEIAKKLRRAPRTVQRRFAEIENES